MTLALVPSLDLALPSLFESAVEYARDARAKNTRRGYESDWKAFEAWGTSHGLCVLPAVPATVAIYLAHLADQGRKVSTIERALAGIVSVQRSRGFEWQKGNQTVRDVLNGIRRRLGSAPSKKAPVLAADLGAMVACLSDTLIGQRDRALITLGWLGAFRRSELVGLRVSDIAYVREGIEIYLRRSKTDQEGKGATKGIPYASDPALCPVRALKDWTQAAAITEGPIFRSVSKRGRVGASLSDKAVALIVQKLTDAAGLDSSRFAGHSLRAGFVTAAAKGKKSLDAIMRQTGHRSERVARGYIGHATVFADNAAVGLI